MKSHITADAHWDSFVIGTVIISHLSDFLPIQLRADDAASERYRNRVHHVQYLRNSIGHPLEPTTAEWLAGLGAMLEVLEVHGQDAAVAQLRPLLAQTRAIVTLPPGGMANIVLSTDVLTMWALEAAMPRFGTTLGDEIHTRYHPRRRRSFR